MNQLNRHIMQMNKKKKKGGKHTRHLCSLININMKSFKYYIDLTVLAR